MKILVTVTRIESRDHIFEVEADSIEEGYKKAEEMANDYDYNLATAYGAYTEVTNYTVKED